MQVLIKIPHVFFKVFLFSCFCFVVFSLFVCLFLSCVPEKYVCWEALDQTNMPWKGFGLRGKRARSSYRQTSCVNFSGVLSYNESSGPRKSPYVTIVLRSIRPALVDLQAYRQRRQPILGPTETCKGQDQGAPGVAPGACKAL